MMEEEIIDLNLEEKYIIFSDNPKKKIPIIKGKINLNLSTNTLSIQYEIKQQ